MPTGSVRILQSVLVLHALYYLPITSYIAWLVPQFATMMSTGREASTQVAIAVVTVLGRSAWRQLALCGCSGTGSRFPR